jgi:pantothenate kinase
MKQPLCLTRSMIPALSPVLTTDTFRWFVDVSSETARSRLIERHLRAGIEINREAAAARVEENDVQNGVLIRSKLIQPDFITLN